VEHDRLFKSLLTTFFVEFLELFFPELTRDLNRESIEFLDKEIFTDIGSGERHEVDLLAKAKLRLLFSYDKPRKAAASRYEVAFSNWKVLDFRYWAIQLNRLNWRSFLKQPNPVASALMVKMKIAEVDRPRVKLECLRMMVKLKLDKARSELIGTFMTSYLQLTAAENLVYNASMATISPREKETVLQISSDWPLMAGRNIITKMLEHRFGKVSMPLLNRIWKLSEPELEAMAVAVMDFTHLRDANAWITALKK
jgi:hypothetical protein